MRSAALVLGSCLGILTAGCGYPPLPAFDAGCGSFASLLDTCKLAFDGDLILSGSATYDTTIHVLMVNGMDTPITHQIMTIESDEVDVLSAHNVQFTGSATLRGTGMRPLAIVASGSITIATDLEIDVSKGGAGAQVSCVGGATVGGMDLSGGAGGGGGGYGAEGGNGGNGNSEGTQSQGGTKGPAVAPVPTGLRGGCPGAAGGGGAAPGGAGGAGGGALYVVAGDRIQLDSVAAIYAGGGGGSGGVQNTSGGNAGGGGGGSGGMLILEAPHITGAGAVAAANGGGGGGGSDSTHPGGDGNPGTLTTSGANGGVGGATSGADGGQGGSKDAPSGESVTAVLNGGGGGGGGGVGIIRILSSDIQGVTTSPDPSP